MNTQTSIATSPTPYDGWAPGANGTETPFYTRSGAHVLYCYNAATRKHAYIDLGTDLEISNGELSNYGLS